MIRFSFSKYRITPAFHLRRLSSASIDSSINSTEGSEVRKPKSEKNVFKVLGPLNVFTAITKIRESLRAKFDESVEISVNTSLDPRKQNQVVKGIAVLPYGSGKKVRVAVFAQGADAQAALAAGADIIGAEDLIAKVQSGDIPFERAIGNIIQPAPLETNTVLQQHPI